MPSGLRSKFAAPKGGGHIPGFGVDGEEIVIKGVFSQREGQCFGHRVEPLTVISITGCGREDNHIGTDIFRHAGDGDFIITDLKPFTGKAVSKTGPLSIPVKEIDDIGIVTGFPIREGGRHHDVWLAPLKSPVVPVK